MLPMALLHGANEPLNNLIGASEKLNGLLHTSLNDDRFGFLINTTKQL